ncbi:hypothetical protein PCH_Pc22g22980 [Penicillium rubens Wisconsin 54-1255]|uniref:Uncharacterized protein n=1 Tax=Penicillium rubens (strain ATCC 28089 / DSM 1075 / NRRL 1951 / Wisconsin 54-1255) TaxID=500485 RepID=B6HV45_PENRW|nr:hypothetical protein PCH_Pc22g22980 [Penicillium rubens Wisconsin 54-1255]
MDILSRQPLGLHSGPYLAQCQTTSNDQGACHKLIEHLSRSGRSKVEFEGVQRGAFEDGAGPCKSITITISSLAGSLASGYVFSVTILCNAGHLPPGYPNPWLSAAPVAAKAGQTMMTKLDHVATRGGCNRSPLGGISKVG